MMIKYTYELVIVSFLHNDTTYLAKEMAENVTDLFLFGRRLELDSNTRRLIRDMINSGASKTNIQNKILAIVNNRLEEIPRVKI